MYLAYMNLPGLGRSLLTGVFWSAFPPYIFGTTRTKKHKLRSHYQKCFRRRLFTLLSAQIQLQINLPLRCVERRIFP